MFALRRAIGLVRSVGRNQIQPKRNASVTYRDQYVPNKSHIRFANTAMFFTWYWIFYNLFTNTEQLFLYWLKTRRAHTWCIVWHLLSPHFEEPDPALWSDEELGIPPEDEED